MEIYRGCPCKGCEPPVRHTLCWNDCERFIAWTKEKNEAMHQIKLEKDRESQAKGFLVEGKIKARKKNNVKWR